MIARLILNSPALPSFEAQRNLNAPNAGDASDTREKRPRKVKGKIKNKSKTDKKKAIERSDKSKNEGNKPGSGKPARAKKSASPAQKQSGSRKKR